MAKYHFVPKVLAGCQCFGSEFWQGKNVPKVSAQNFMPKFRAKAFGTNIVAKFLAEIFGTKDYFGTQMYRPYESKLERQG